MNEVAGVIEQQKALVIRDNLDRYAQLVGISSKRYPKTPDELPNNLFLPGALLGDMKQAIDAVSADKKERNQFIDWDEDTQQFRKGPLYIGDETGNSIADAAHRGVKAFFGKKSLLDYHVHPNGVWTFSQADMAHYQGFPREALIHAVSSDQGISFLFQTAKSARLPFSAALRLVMTDIQAHLIDVWSPQDQAAFWEKRGWGYYLWVPAWEKVTLGDMVNGINLKKVS